MKSNTLYAGVDLHKQFSYITILNREGEKIKQQKVSHKGEQLKLFFEQFDQPLEIAVEATFNSYWFWNLIESEKKRENSPHRQCPEDKGYWLWSSKDR